MFSLRSLLYLIAAAPLSAFLWLSGSAVLDGYIRYGALEEQLIVQRLAHAGGEIAQVLPAEAFAKRSDLAERRDAVDRAFAALDKAYRDWKGQGNSDQAIDGAYRIIQDKLKLLPNYRRNVDAGTADSNEALLVLQPASAAGLELVRRSASTIADLDLARFIDGYHALMQVNDAGLIEIRLGEKFLAGRQLVTPEYAFLLYAKGLRDHSTPVLREHLPEELIEEFDHFADSAEGKFLAEVRAVMYQNEPKGEDKAALEGWSSQTGNQNRIMADLLEKAGNMLNAKAQGALAELRGLFIRGAITAVLVSLVVFGICIFVLRQVSRMIRAIERRMQQLADGDTQSPIPFVDRKDAIGDMAHSVEVFRQAAIRNAQLETEAEENRQRAERERVEVQRLAEAEAEDRLNRATGSLASALRELAAGDMLCEIEEQFAPQFEALRHDFNASVAQLRQVLLAVGKSAGAVRGGSSEISSASSNLADRTEKQAASLEETAAALEEITSNVQATSKRTGEAQNLVRNAKDHAEGARVVVGNAVAAMGRIETASQQISQIIGVIDEIAFQTNLLALNAGVEAARAGEAGKGFAVVAQEVRELAQRSANAAKEIKALIGNSEVAVSEGVKLVNDTDQGLHSIAVLVQTINQHMDAIASAAQQQSVGLGEVNSAVNHMDQATQQNAAMVEEMNAASAGLAQESSNLSEMLNRFRTHKSEFKGNLALAAQECEQDSLRRLPSSGASTGYPRLGRVG
ncbi:HAMP domain-containing protein [Mesorhizobium plurifarium]|uniref:methyl-accepting chemotaxis protein n=1 Tax=Sinorhizobium arboris TaxID=76745 RepID=UPI0003F53D60|nr:methyl-accepting chemotaxis protein [Sinorhizobium arboris]PST20730.1 HAMP domain-containing protein [Mesorhizobium plurifarium]